MNFGNFGVHGWERKTRGRGTSPPVSLPSTPIGAIGPKKLHSLSPTKCFVLQYRLAHDITYRATKRHTLLVNLAYIL